MILYSTSTSPVLANQVTAVHCPRPARIKATPSAAFITQTPPPPPARPILRLQCNLHQHTAMEPRKDFKFSLTLLFFQAVMVVLFGTVVKYGKLSTPPPANSTAADNIDYAGYYPSKWLIFSSVCAKSCAVFESCTLDRMRLLTTLLYF